MMCALGLEVGLMPAWGLGERENRVFKAYRGESMASENVFKKTPADKTPPPSLDEVWMKLPRPYWKGHEKATEAYRKAWEIAFTKLKAPTEGNGFVSPYSDTDFNNNTFMWDTCFTILYGRYAVHGFDYIRSLDNFYAKQTPDGYICREIRNKDGSDCWEQMDFSSTGPNIMSWPEWEHYLSSGDKERLARVFPPLVACYRWFRHNRSWKDGSYFYSGLGSGMDNLPRFKPTSEAWIGHGHLSWIDATAQQIMSGKILFSMAEAIGRTQDVRDIADEVKLLERFVNENMWNADLSFYTDVDREGKPSDVQTVGSFWTLLADVVPPDRVDPFTASLKDEKRFNRPHRVPALSANHPEYNPKGGYWRGGVWAPTTYMVLRGLTKIGKDDLAYAIARNHFDNVLKVYEETGTFFENYAPEDAKGNDRRDFVGWTGLPPIAVFLEYVIGLRPNVPERTLVWDVRQLEEMGVDTYPFGKDGVLNLSCAARSSVDEEPQIKVESNVPLTLLLKWKGGEKALSIMSEDGKKD